MAISVKLREHIEMVESDVNHHYECYAQEAIAMCNRLTEKLEGRIVKFKALGRPEMRGRISQVYDQSGTVVIWVIIIPKRGIEKMGKEIGFSEIVSWETKRGRP